MKGFNWRVVSETQPLPAKSKDAGIKEKAAGKARDHSKEPCKETNSFPDMPCKEDHLGLALYGPRG